MPTEAKSVRLGIITGLPMEAALIPAAAHVGVYCQGPGPAAAAACVDQALADGATLLISFGTAGGLSADLRPGSLLLPHHILTRPNDGPIRAEDRLQTVAAELVARIGGDLGAQSAPMIGSDQVIADPAEKTVLHRHHGAVAVDMESHVVGARAEQAGLPFLVVRAVTDPSDRPLPRWLLGCVRRDGTTHYLRLAARVARDPRRIGPLLQLGRDAEAAKASMRRAAALVVGLSDAQWAQALS